MYGQSRKTKLLREAAIEFRDRLEYAKFRKDAVWNEAVRACMGSIGREHELRHGAECFICWARKKLSNLLVLDSAGYVPVRERMIHAVQEASSRCGYSGQERRAYMAAMEDAKKILDGLVEDFE